MVAGNGLYYRISIKDMEEVKKEEMERSNNQQWFSSCRSWAHWRWVKALIGLVVLVIIFGIGVKLGEFKARFFDEAFGPFGGGHFYAQRWGGGCWGGEAPMMYGGQYQGQYNPYGMMRGYYYQGQNQGATTTPQTVPGQQP